MRKIKMKIQLLENLRKIKKENLLAIVLMCAIIILVVIFVYLNMSKNYKSYSIQKTFERNDSNTKEYMTYQENKILRYSTDGISTMDKDGNVLWMASYEMTSPKVVMAGEYVAVADIGGTAVNIYDKSGNASVVSNTLKIEQVEISEQGILALLVNDGMSNHIKIMDESKEYIDIKTRLKDDGYIMDYTFSPDSKKLVTSTMCVDGSEISNSVTCYNLGEIGKSYESKIVAGYTYEDKMVPRVQFINESKFVVFTENNFEIYSMKEIPENVFKSSEFKHNIRSVFCSDEYIGIILENNDEYLKEIKVYNLEGKLKFDEKISYDYSKVLISGNDIILYTSNDAMIYEISGNVKFDGDFKEQIEYILPDNDKKRYYFITSENIYRVKLTKGD